MTALHMGSYLCLHVKGLGLTTLSLEHFHIIETPCIVYITPSVNYNYVFESTFIALVILTSFSPTQHSSRNWKSDSSTVSSLTSSSSGDDVVELLSQDVPLVLLVLDAHGLPVHGINDSQVVNETRLRAAAIYIIMAQSQVQLSATGLEGQNMDRCYVFACWVEAPRGVSTQHTGEY